MSNCIFKMFQNDLSEHIRDSGIQLSTWSDGIREPWYYCFNQLPLDDIIRMNRELGIHKINKKSIYKNLPEKHWKNKKASR